MLQIKKYINRNLLAFFIICMTGISAGLISAEAADSSVTFTVE